MAGNIFISYAREDRAYVERLAAFLRKQGVPTWYDRGLSPGERWDQALQAQIESCAALLVVMTPAADRSRWVTRELNLAEHCQRAVVPLLLDGRVFFRLDNLHYESVAGDAMPGPRLTDRLRELAKGENVATTAAGELGRFQRTDINDIAEVFITSDDAEGFLLRKFGAGGFLFQRYRPEVRPFTPLASFR